MSDTDDAESTAQSLLGPFHADIAQLVRGASALPVGGNETPDAVVVDALRAFFREYDTARDAGAVQQYVAGEIPRHRVGELVGQCGGRLDATIAEYRPKVQSDDSQSDVAADSETGVDTDAGEDHDAGGDTDADADTDADSDTDAGSADDADDSADDADDSPGDADDSTDAILAAVADADPGLRTLIRGASQVGIGGLDAEVDVLRAALRWYFQTHESLRHAATARQYALGRMTTGTASQMADVQKGPEVEQLLWEHGVRPRVGPEPSEAAEREEQVILSKLFDGITAPDSDVDDAN